MIETALGITALAGAVALLGIAIAFGVVIVASAYTAVTGRSK
jgi:hypothetical protein